MSTKINLLLLVQILALGFSPAQADDADPLSNLHRQVEQTERAFAQTMADRDFVAFKAFLDQETVFFDGEQALRGAEAVAEAWRRYFEKPAAPFSWAPETVAVLDSGTLALSSGPVLDPEGKRIATFQSVWRRQAGGGWKIIFDKGSRYCEVPQGAN